MQSPRSFTLLAATHNQHYFTAEYAAQLRERFRALYGNAPEIVKHDVAYCSEQTTNGTYCYLPHNHDGFHVFSVCDTNAAEVKKE